MVVPIDWELPLASLSLDSIKLVLSLVDHPSIRFDLSTNPERETPEIVSSEVGNLGTRICSESNLAADGMDHGAALQRSTQAGVGQVHEALAHESGENQDGNLSSPGKVALECSPEDRPFPVPAKGTGGSVLSLISASEVNVCLDHDLIMRQLTSLPLSVVEWLCSGEGSHYDWFTGIAALVGLGQPAEVVPLGIILKEKIAVKPAAGQTLQGSGDTGLLVLSTETGSDTRWNEFAKVNHLKVIKL